MGARLLDEAEVDLDEGSDPAHPATGHGHRRSPSSWAARRGRSACSPTAGDPLDLAQGPEVQKARRPHRLVPLPFVSSSSNIARARSISPRRIMSRASEIARARLIVEGEPEALLHFGASLEQAGSDFGRPGFHLTHPRNGPGDQPGLANALGLLQSQHGRRRGPRARRPATSGSRLGGPGFATSARRRRPPRREPRQRARSASKSRP